MSDYITRQAQRVVDRITADAVASATTAYGKPLPIQVQQGIECAIADLLPGLEAEQRQEEADWQAEQVKRLGPALYFGASVSGVQDEKAGGTSSDD